MKKLLAVLLAAGALSCAVGGNLFAQGVVLMPDSTNNRLVAFDPVTGAVVNPNMFALAAGTPISAIQVGDEIWVSEQIGDRISRWSLTGVSLGQIGGGPTGGLDNVRGITLIGDVIYVANDGTGNGAPGPSVVMFSTSGAPLGNFSTTGFAPGPFYILGHQGTLLVSSDSANNDIHRFTLSGMSVGPFHNSTSLNFAEQMTISLSGSVIAAGFTTNNVVFLDPNNGSLLSSFAAAGARGVYQLGNGNVLWTNGSGAHVWNSVTNTSTQVYTGGGRFFAFAPVPEPSTLAAFALGALGLSAMLRARRR